MKRFAPVLLFSASVLFFLTAVSQQTAECQEATVRAKIGIQIRSAGTDRWAKSRDRVKEGDLLRLYVHPEKASYIYVVYSDKKSASLLAMTGQKVTTSSLVLPSVSDYYELDGKSAVETFTIICSREQVPEIDHLFETGPAYTHWMDTERALQEKSKIEFNTKNDAPFAIAGNVRGEMASVDRPTLVNDLKIFSGNAMVVKRYELEIEE